MPTSTITIRIDENVKSELQNLMSELGMDITTFFTMAAKQAIREKALPFLPKANTSIYPLHAYTQAMTNTRYNSEGKAVISSDDEWLQETEWDEIFEQMKKEKS